MTTTKIAYWDRENKLVWIAFYADRTEGRQIGRAESERDAYDLLAEYGWRRSGDFGLVATGSPLRSVKVSR